MPRFEFEEGTSSKFWEIRLQGSTFTTRYGKIGTEGQETVKEFDSAEKARKEHDKLIAEKRKKGYVEVGAGDVASCKTKSDAAGQVKTPLGAVRVLTLAEARQELELHKVIHPGRADDNERLVVARGPVTVDSLPLDFQSLDEWLGIPAGDTALLGLVVDGDLTVRKWILNWESDFGPFLWVKGSLQAKGLGTGGSEVIIDGDVAVDTFFGFYNHGRTVVRGEARCALVAVEEHAMRFEKGLAAEVVIGGNFLAIGSEKKLKAGAFTGRLYDLNDKPLKGVVSRGMEAYARLADTVVDKAEWDEMEEEEQQEIREAGDEMDFIRLDRDGLLKAIQEGLPTLQAPMSAKGSTTKGARHFTLVEGTSSKFWEIALEGDSLTTRYGRIGTDGQSTRKEFDSADMSRKEYDKLVAEKIKKGYKEG